MTNDIDIEARAAFSRNLRAFRRRLGLSQNEVARATGIALTHVSDIELRKVNFTVDTAVKLAAGLNMPL